MTSHQQQTPQDTTADTHSSNEHPAQAFRDVENDEEQEGSAKAMRGPDVTVDSPRVSNASDGKLPLFLSFFSLTLHF